MFKKTYITFTYPQNFDVWPSKNSKSTIDFSGNSFTTFSGFQRTKILIEANLFASNLKAEGYPAFIVPRFGNKTSREEKVIALTDAVLEFNNDYTPKFLNENEVFTVKGNVITEPVVNPYHYMLMKFIAPMLKNFNIDFVNRPVWTAYGWTFILSSELQADIESEIDVSEYIDSYFDDEYLTGYYNFSSGYIKKLIEVSRSIDKQEKLTEELRAFYRNFLMKTNK